MSSAVSYACILDMVAVEEAVSVLERKSTLRSTCEQGFSERQYGPFGTRKLILSNSSNSHLR
jgi:hypothetical protein